MQSMSSASDASCSSFQERTFAIVFRKKSIDVLCAAETYSYNTSKGYLAALYLCAQRFTWIQSSGKRISAAVLKGNKVTPPFSGRSQQKAGICKSLCCYAVEDINVVV